MCITSATITKSWISSGDCMIVAINNAIETRWTSFLYLSIYSRNVWNLAPTRNFLFIYRTQVISQLADECNNQGWGWTYAIYDHFLFHNCCHWEKDNRVSYHLRYSSCYVSPPPVCSKNLFLSFRLPSAKTHEAYGNSYQSLRWTHKSIKTHENPDMRENFR